MCPQTFCWYIQNTTFQILNKITKCKQGITVWSPNKKLNVKYQLFSSGVTNHSSHWLIYSPGFSGRSHKDMLACKLQSRVSCNQPRCGFNGIYFTVFFLFFLAATKQLYEWYFLSVCPSVRPSVRPSVLLSVCHTFLTMFPSSYHHEIFRSYHIGPG